MTWQALKTVARDAGCLVMGFGGIGYQQWTGQVNPWLLAVYTAMIGLPGALGLVQMGRGTGKQETPTTTSPSSASPPPPSSSSS